MTMREITPSLVVLRNTVATQAQSTTGSLLCHPRTTAASVPFAPCWLTSPDERDDPRDCVLEPVVDI